MLLPKTPGHSQASLGQSLLGSLLLSEVRLDIFGEAALTGLSVTHQVMAQGPLGEQDDVMLTGLLDLGQVCQDSEEPDRSPLDLHGLAGFSLTLVYCIVDI